MVSLGSPSPLPNYSGPSGQYTLEGNPNFFKPTTGMFQVVDDKIDYSEVQNLTPTTGPEADFVNFLLTDNNFATIAGTTAEVFDLNGNPVPEANLDSISQEDLRAAASAAGDPNLLEDADVAALNANADEPETYSNFLQTLLQEMQEGIELIFSPNSGGFQGDESIPSLSPFIPTIDFPNYPPTVIEPDEQQGLIDFPVLGDPNAPNPPLPEQPVLNLLPGLIDFPVLGDPNATNPPVPEQPVVLNPTP